MMRVILLLFLLTITQSNIFKKLYEESAARHGGSSQTTAPIASSSIPSTGSCLFDRQMLIDQLTGYIGSGSDGSSVSTVASECAFSTLGCLIDDHMTSLDMATIQTVMYLQDWWASEEKCQNLDHVANIEDRLKDLVIANTAVEQ